MRRAITRGLILCSAVALHAQAPQSTPAAARLQFGPILGIAASGLSHASGQPGDVASTSGNGTSPYVGLFARRSLTRSLHAEVQTVFDLKGDDGANYAIGFLQVPLLLQYTPLAPRRVGTWVRPVLIGGASAGVRLRANGGRGTEYDAIRPFELSLVAGLGVEAHFRSKDWVQLAVVMHNGLTDLQPQPGTTTGYAFAAYVKAHPGAMRR
jgi:hypothetical protein